MAKMKEPIDSIKGEIVKRALERPDHKPMAQAEYAHRIDMLMVMLDRFRDELEDEAVRVRLWGQIQDAPITEMTITLRIGQRKRG